MKKYFRLHNKINRLYCLFNIKYEINYLVKHGKYNQQELYHICCLTNEKLDLLNTDLSAIALSELQKAYDIVNMIYAEERTSNIFS